VTLELNHTGERLTLRRIKTDNGVEELHLAGSLPAHRRRLPLPIHFEEDEHGEVVSSSLSALVDGKTLMIRPVVRVIFQRVAHIDGGTTMMKSY